MRIAIIILSLIVALCRILGYKSEAYQALAHLFVGYLFAFWLIGKDSIYLYLLIGLTIVEIACFILL